jgi:microcin C transport system permease protein
VTILAPLLREQLAKPAANIWRSTRQPLRAEVRLNTSPKGANPREPTRENLLGTDDRGRDMLAQLIYGFRLSVLFGLALTVDRRVDRV